MVVENPYDKLVIRFSNKSLTLKIKNDIIDLSKETPFFINNWVNKIQKKFKIDLYNDYINYLEKKYKNK